MFHIFYVHVRNWNKLSDVPFQNRFWIIMRKASSNEHGKFDSNYVREHVRVCFFIMLDMLIAMCTSGNREIDGCAQILKNTERFMGESQWCSTSHKKTEGKNSTLHDVAFATNFHDYPDDTLNYKHQFL